MVPRACVIKLRILILARDAVPKVYLRMRETSGKLSSIDLPPLMIIGKEYLQFVNV